jgi:hypothetical protein
MDVARWDKNYFYDRETDDDLNQVICAIKRRMEEKP